MNWKKFLLFAGIGAAVPTLDTWVQHPVAFTWGNIGVPIISSLATTLLALFAHPPHDDATAAGQSTATLPGAAK